MSSYKSPSPLGSLYRVTSSSSSSSSSSNNTSIIKESNLSISKL